MGAGRLHDREVADALIDICRGTPPQIPSGPAFADSLVRAARHHRVAPLAHVRLRDTHPALGTLLADDRDATRAHHIRSTMVLGEVRRILAEIPWATFKGPVLSETAHPVPGLRTYNDLDVLVEPSSLRAVAERLGDAGWLVADSGDMLLNPDTPGEMHWLSPAGIVMDLHWSMVNMASRRRLVTIPTAELLARRVRVRVGFHDVWALDPVDAMVHVAAHAALTGGNKMIWLLDVDQMARQTRDWGEAARRAREWHVAPHMALMLRRSAAVLRTPLPPGLDAMLGTSPAFRALVDITDRVSPVPRLAREASGSRLVARAVRHDARSTVAVVARNSLRHLRDRGLLSRPAEFHRPRADDGALQAYFEAAEAGG